MKLISKVLICAVVIAILVLFSIITPYSRSVPKISPNSTVCFGDRCFAVELARTPQEQETGLMYRKSLGKDNGMLFIFSAEDIYSFWMKNTLIPLDMIWADKNSKIVFASENVQPCAVENCPITIPSARASYVLEVNAGIVKDVGLKIGDELKINIAGK